ncbi:hypothetical protein JMJ77_0007142 [Colletotrichum scovillei]|uniref:Uncharacterized protein n=1 Tax=Colletotrichum scovillei TaxID=1209932 RepID=A0A9P7RC67_9PEZI|nr:hypothetical protein JMJ77_0007142 [Colletotrichum scovillei]KAG7074108.1 hypothetical protein JMJ76_0010595 [Colletotrichum scovillei]KAG7081484.1 hypothetical protein JMJ78_0003604 [Colletotrichum scovillei]
MREALCIRDRHRALDRAYDGRLVGSPGQRPTYRDYWLYRISAHPR